MLALLVCLSLLVIGSRAHGYIALVEGRNCQQGLGFGVTANAGQDRAFDRTIVSRFNSATAPRGCGSSIADGAIDIARFTNESIIAGVPSFATGKAFDIVYHQLNAGPDGGGPLRAFIDKTGTGNSFIPLPMARNINQQGKGNTAHSVAIAVPSQVTCTGVGGTCLFAVLNPVKFGNCFIAKPTKASKLRARARKTAALRMIRRTRRSTVQSRRSLSIQQ